MKRVYAVRQITGLGEPVAVCESRYEALLLAEHVAYIDEEKGQTVEDYVFELPYISAEPYFDGGEAA